VSLLAHALLVAALALGVSWHTETPVAVEAELWAAVPEAAAPPAVEPTPPPIEVAPPEPAPQPAAAEPEPPPVVEREAEIALEKARLEELALQEQQAEDAKQARELELRLKKAEREQKAERERKLAQERKAEQARTAQAEAEAAEKLALQRKEDLAKRQAQAKKDKAEDAKREASRQEQIARMSAQLSTTTGGNGSANSVGTAARSAEPSAGYGGKIKAAIKPNIVFPPAIAGNPEAEVEVHTAADGTILSKRISKSSGNRDWDEAVLRAIEKTARLPKDIDGRVEPTLLISFRPNE
jgi:colicin import membrane protein